MEGLLRGKRGKSDWTQETSKEEAPEDPGHQAPMGLNWCCYWSQLGFAKLLAKREGRAEKLGSSPALSNPCMFSSGDWSMPFRLLIIPESWNTS